MGVAALLAPVSTTVAQASTTEPTRPAATTAVTKIVSMKDGAASCPTSPTGCYAPKTLTIRKGDSVKWTNPTAGSAAHTAFGMFVADGATSPAKKFTTTGTFSYRCSLHFSMTGTIKVTL